MTITEVYITHRMTYRRGTEMNAYASGRRFSGIVVALSGKMDYALTDGERITLCEGEIMYLPEMSGYIVRTPYSDFEHCTLNFGLAQTADFPMSDKLREVMFGTKPTVIKPSSFEETIRLCDRVINCRRYNTVASELLCRAYLYELLHMFVTTLESDGGDVARKALMPAKEYIEHHYTESIQISTLAEKCAMSETHFRRRFKQAFGTAPNEYVTTLRLSRAKELLLTRLYRVSEIAEMSGYDDANYFARLFKRKVGMTPIEYTESR